MYRANNIWVKSCRTGKKCLKCPNFTLTQRLALSKPSILQTWVFCPAGILLLAHPHKNFHLPGLPGNVCRKGLKFPENPGNLNWWNCNIILMSINEAYLVALRATVTLTYIPWDTHWWLVDSMTHFLDLLRHFLGILDGFLDLFWSKYWYFNTDLFILFWVSRVLLCIIVIMVIMYCIVLSITKNQQ